jgi:predicted nuclease of predicted toxin-antitoxin system
MLGMSRATDEQIMELAVQEDRIVVSQDTDFGTLLAFSNAIKPSYVLIPRANDATAAEIAGLLTANLPAVADDLDSGATVSITDDSVRVRRHPYGIDS